MIDNREVLPVDPCDGHFACCKRAGAEEERAAVVKWLRTEAARQLSLAERTANTLALSCLLERGAVLNEAAKAVNLDAHRARNSMSSIETKDKE